MEVALRNLTHIWPDKIMIKVDMHVHTKYSKDSILSLERLFIVCRKRGIDCIAVTDHNTIKGALEFQKRFNGVKVIVGEEIESRAGEIIGLFLQEEVSPGLSAGKTIVSIKKQGGLVYLPHPFDRCRRAPIKLKSIEPFWDEIDIVEVFNSRSLISSWSEKALELAKEKKKPFGIGSDAHSEKEVGKSLAEMEDFNSPVEFVDNLTQAKIKKKKTSLMLRLSVRAVRLAKGKEQGTE